MPAATDVVDLARARGANEFGKGFDQIEAVNVVSDLLSFVPENPIRSVADGTDHQVREKTMQFGPSVRRAGETAATKRNGWHPEISPVFLDENIRRNFRRAEKRMLGVIDTHRLRNTGLVFVAWLYFPAFFEFAQRQTVRRVAIDFVRRRENERRLGRKLSRRFEQIQRAVRVHSKISLRIAGSPVV